MVIAIYNQKGGVGKSFIASHIAMLLGYYRHRVSLVDLDGQASCMKWVGGQNADRTWRWNGEDKTMTSRGVDLLWGSHPDFMGDEERGGYPPIPQGYEFVVIDCNPLLESLNAMIDLVDLIVVPVIGRFSYDSATNVKEIVSGLRGEVKVSVLKNQMLPARMVAGRQEEAFLKEVGADIFSFGLHSLV
jgi:chromosome partitioning protein